MFCIYIMSLALALDAPFLEWCFSRFGKEMFICVCACARVCVCACACVCMFGGLLMHYYFEQVYRVEVYTLVVFMVICLIICGVRGANRFES